MKRRHRSDGNLRVEYHCGAACPCRRGHIGRPFGRVLAAEVEGGGEGEAVGGGLESRLPGGQALVAPGPHRRANRVSFQRFLQSCSPPPPLAAVLSKTRQFSTLQESGVDTGCANGTLFKKSTGGIDEGVPTKRCVLGRGGGVGEPQP